MCLPIKFLHFTSKITSFLVAGVGVIFSITGLIILVEDSAYPGQVLLRNIERLGLEYFSYLQVLLFVSLGSYGL